MSDKGQGPPSPNLWSVGPEPQKGMGRTEVFKKMMKEVSEFGDDAYSSDEEAVLPRSMRRGNSDAQGKGASGAGGHRDSDDSDDDDHEEILDFINAGKASVKASPKKAPGRSGEAVPSSLDRQTDFQQEKTDSKGGSFDGFHRAEADRPPPSLDGRQQTRRVDELREHVLRPMGQAGRVTTCYVERERGPSNYLNPNFRLYTDKTGDEEEGGGGGTPTSKNRKRGGDFLLSARKISEKKKSYYVITLAEAPSDVRDSMLVGKLRANWAGTEYSIFDHGLNPDKTEVPSMRRREFGLISFSYSELGPGKIQVYLPAVTSTGASQVWRPGPGEASLAEAVTAGETDKLLHLQNKSPAWNNELRGYALDFNGRVTMPSVKNFQLAPREEPDTVLLQFGKVDKHGFVLDFGYPLSILQAFAVALASMDSKLADHKGFDLIRQVMERRDSGEEGAKSRPGSTRSSSGGRKLGEDGADAAGTASPRKASLLKGLKFPGGFS